MDGRVLVREQSEYGYGRASWEINLGYNYACSHCYLGLKEFSGLPWPDKERLLHMMRDAGVVWLQITGGEPTIDKHFADAYRQSAEHLRTRKAFTGCNAGHTFFHSDPHGLVSICKVGRDDQIDLMREGLQGLSRLGGIADNLMLRTGGCSGCQLAGSCRVCRPLAKQYQEAKAPLTYYCQHNNK